MCVLQEYRIRDVYKTWKLLHFFWAVWQQGKHAFYSSEVKMLPIEGSTQTVVYQMLLCMITRCAARWRMGICAFTDCIAVCDSAVNTERKDQSCPVVNMKIILWEKNLCQKINLNIPAAHGYVTLSLLNRLFLGESDILTKNQVQSNDLFFYFVIMCHLCQLYL